MIRNNVLVVAGEISTGLGGPLNVLVAEAGSMSARYRLTVLVPATTSTDEKALVALSEAGCVVRQYPNPVQGRLRLWALSPSMISAIWRESRTADLVHVHGPWWLPGLAAMLSARVRRRPVVLTPHGSFMDSVAWAGSLPIRLAKRLLRPLIDASVSRIVYASAYEEQASSSRRSAGKAVLIHHGLQLPDRPICPSVVAPDFLVVGFLGRLHPVKNVESLIRAIGLSVEGTRLEIAGTGSRSYVESLHALTGELGIQDRVVFRGEVHGHSKWAFLEAVDVLMLPSLGDSFGLSAAEAMVCGRAVVVSPETGIAELVDDVQGGLVVAPNPSAIAEALKALARDPELLQRFGANALLARSRLSIAAHAAALDNLYEDLLGQYQIVLERRADAQ